MAYYTQDECQTIIMHYEAENRKPGWCGPGHILGARRYTDEQLLAITNRIVDEMGFDWLTEDVWVREEITSTKCKIDSFNVDWIKSPYYKYASPRKPLPENVEEIIQNLKERMALLQLKLEKRVQKVSTGQRSRQYRKKVYA